MDYKLILKENNNIVLSTDNEDDSWRNEIVIDNIDYFSFDQNFITVGNDKVTKFIRFGNLTIDKNVGAILKKGRNESENIE